ncbi:hypothetical protein ACFHWD_03970 [Clostridium sp. MT-14]|uniref:hypothetical protein n=1 Tax=Clostridium sp. MT-14 TaxID=3348360 RepID=UPI0035F22504
MNEKGIRITNGVISCCNDAATTPLYVYIDVYQTKKGMKTSIFGDGYLVLRDVTMSTIGNIVKTYNNNLVHKYGNNVDLTYFIDIRGLGLGVYQLLKEQLKEENINICKLDIV